MQEVKNCLICKTTEEEMPLLNFTFKGQQYHICSAHIPVLIHKSHELSSILPGFEEKSSLDQ
jgi:hypothetical protein